jgi:Raf kinase inhibitor-like YbhB/YbcL family protein
MSRSRLLAPLLAGVALATASLGCTSSPDTTTAPSSTSASPSASASSSTSSGGSAGTATNGTSATSTFTLTSTAFADNGEIPLTYACGPQGGTGASPPLAWSGVPKGTTSLVLVVHDPDAAPPKGFTHLVTSFPVSTTSVADKANQAGAGPMTKWLGPCPPSGTHHYEFTLYAFGASTTVSADADKAAIDAIAGQALATAKLTGLFTKH